MIVKLIKLFAFLGVLFVGLLIFDAYRFVLNCRTFHQQGELGTKQLGDNYQQDYLMVVLTGDKDRIPAALELLQTYPKSQLLISGLSKKTSLSEIAARVSDKYRLDSEIWKRVAVDSEATSTVENAKETQKYLTKHGIQRLVLVTSDYHLTRSVAIFDKWVSAELVPYAIPSDWWVRASVEYWKWVAFRFNIL